MVNVKQTIIQVVTETWKERLTTCFANGNSPDETLLREWQQQTLAQVDTLYGKYYHHNETTTTSSSSSSLEEEIQQCIRETISTWKSSQPLAESNKVSETTSSFSLFSSFGNGLPAFFSWPQLSSTEKTDEEIWQALGHVEYLDDVYPDWEDEIKPWIRARMSSSSSSAATACHLFRQWYGKARHQESPETTQITLGMMEIIFQIIFDESQSTTITRDPLLRVGLDMVTDYMVRKGTCPPTLCIQCLWNASLTMPPTLVDTLSSQDPTGRWLRLALQTHPSLYRNLGAVSLDVTLLANFLRQSSSTETSDSSSKSDSFALPRRRHLYALALLTHMVITVRVSGFPWAAWHAARGEDVYALLWTAVRDPMTPNRELFVQGLEAWLDGSKEEERDRIVFRRDWVSFINEQHHDDSRKVLEPLERFVHSQDVVK